jgi:hypothetical protein
LGRCSAASRDSLAERGRLTGVTVVDADDLRNLLASIPGGICEDQKSRTFGR